MIRHALTKGLKVRAWTFDELYGRDSKFLDGLDELGEGYVAEIPADTELWTSKPNLTRRQPVKREKRGRKQNTPRIVRSRPACEVRNLIHYSSKFQKQDWQRYHIKDTDKGPEVWEVKWLRVWRKTQDKLPSRQQTLIVARNVRTGEMKFFLSNLVVGRNGVTLRCILRIAFGRWSIEACFRTAKEELGLDHFEVRGWRCIHRHYYLTGMSYLLCGRIREKLGSAGTGELTVEQVRQCINTYLTFHHLPTEHRDREFEKALDHLHYYQTRNTTAKNSHTKTRRQLYAKMGIDVDKIKSCVLHPPTNETQ
jgi:SRSO17 transposase